MNSIKLYDSVIYELQGKTKPAEKEGDVQNVDIQDIKKMIEAGNIDEALKYLDAAGISHAESELNGAKVIYFEYTMEGSSVPTKYTYYYMPASEDTGSGSEASAQTQNSITSYAQITMTAAAQTTSTPVAQSNNSSSSSSEAQMLKESDTPTGSFLRMCGRSETAILDTATTEEELEGLYIRTDDMDETGKTVQRFEKITLDMLPITLRNSTIFKLETDMSKWKDGDYGHLKCSYYVEEVEYSADGITVKPGADSSRETGSFSYRDTASIKEGMINQFYTAFEEKYGANMSEEAFDKMFALCVDYAAQNVEMVTGTDFQNNEWTYTTAQYMLEALADAFKNYSSFGAEYSETTSKMVMNDNIIVNYTEAVYKGSDNESAQNVTKNQIVDDLLAMEDELKPVAEAAIERWQHTSSINVQATDSNCKRVIKAAIYSVINSIDLTQDINMSDILDAIDGAANSQADDYCQIISHKCISNAEQFDKEYGSQTSTENLIEVAKIKGTIDTNAVIKTGSTEQTGSVKKAAQAGNSSTAAATLEETIEDMALCATQIPGVYRTLAPVSSHSVDVPTYNTATHESSMESITKYDYQYYVWNPATQTMVPASCMDEYSPFSNGTISADEYEKQSKCGSEHEGLILAYIRGYNITSQENVYEKDGKYYEYKQSNWKYDFYEIEQPQNSDDITIYPTSSTEESGSHVTLVADEDGAKTTLKYSDGTEIELVNYGTNSEDIISTVIHREDGAEEFYNSIQGTVLSYFFTKDEDGKVISANRTLCGEIVGGYYSPHIAKAFTVYLFDKLCNIEGGEEWFKENADIRDGACFGVYNTDEIFSKYAPEIFGKEVADTCFYKDADGNYKLRSNLTLGGYSIRNEKDLVIALSTPGLRDIIKEACS